MIFFFLLYKKNLNFRTWRNGVWQLFLLPSTRRVEVKRDSFPELKPQENLINKISTYNPMSQLWAHSPAEPGRKGPGRCAFCLLADFSRWAANVIRNRCVK